LIFFGRQPGRRRRRNELAILKKGERNKTSVVQRRFDWDDALELRLQFPEKPPTWLAKFLPEWRDTQTFGNSFFRKRKKKTFYFDKTK
jgi:hypothetical protein